MTLWVIRDRVELAAGPAMSAMLRKRKQNQSIGICRDGPGFRVKPRARPWLRSRRARLGHLVVVDRRDGLSTSGGSGIEPGGGSICGNALKTRLPRRGYASPSLGLRVALVGATRRPRRGYASPAPLEKRFGSLAIGDDVVIIRLDRRVPSSLRRSFLATCSQLSALWTSST
jgi:hypothetical protein